jgi:polyisoprenoid-binding protein YceI
METQTFQVDNTQSHIEWTGRKVTGSHNGTIPVKSGTLTFGNGQLSGGTFIIDTTGIRILDVTDPATNAQFAGHLASDDFFSSERFPEATLAITSAEERAANRYAVTGDLTIKGITHPIHFDLNIHGVGNALTASTQLSVDRTKYDMKFRSGNFFQNLGDNLIYNEFELQVRLTANLLA